MTVLAHKKLLERQDDIFASGTYVESGFHPFSYELRLANDDCLVNGVYQPLGESIYSENAVIEIPPGQLAFLSTKEEFKLAPDLLGRFGLKFKHVRCGLVPLLTTFIEPGSTGRLYFPVLNASSDTIELRAGEEIITAMFHLVPLPKGISNLESPPGWKILPTDIIKEHLKIRMVSTIELENRIQALNNEIEFVKSGQERVIALAVTVITATILGAVIQTMFGLFAITQGITASSQPSNIAWIIIPSTLYCFSIVFVALIVGIILIIRKPRQKAINKS